MAVRIVRLGTPRTESEGLRIGTVRRPPRGVPKTEFASRDFYDVWLPILSPSPELMKKAQLSTDEKSWAEFAQKFQAEMKGPEAARTLDLLAALSRQTDFAIGCYCRDESKCHRSILRKLLLARGAEIL